MYVQGVSTRRVKRIVEELCGMDVSSSQVSRAAGELDELPVDWREREPGAYRYIVLDARYGKVRQGGQVTFDLEIREFDTDNAKETLEFINILTEQSGLAVGTADPAMGALLNKLGSAARTGLFKDDVISAYKATFLPCDGSGTARDKQLYLMAGQIAFVHMPQAENYVRPKNLSWG